LCPSDIFREEEDFMEGHVRIEKIKYFYIITLAGKYQRVKPLDIVDVEHRTIFKGVCVCVCACARDNVYLWTFTAMVLIILVPKNRKIFDQLCDCTALQ
jgi:hypothetical protein